MYDLKESFFAFTSWSTWLHLLLDWQVDRNVSRHISKSLAADDWEVLILHYLGLDHIGHLEGPMSHLIGPKLLEMDHVVKNIHEGLEAKVSIVTLLNVSS